MAVLSFIHFHIALFLIVKMKHQKSNKWKTFYLQLELYSWLDSWLLYVFQLSKMHIDQIIGTIEVAAYSNYTHTHTGGEIALKWMDFLNDLKLNLNFLYAPE